MIEWKGRLRGATTLGLAGVSENAAGPDGKAIKVDPVALENAMTVEDGTRQIVAAN